MLTLIQSNHVLSAAQGGPDVSRSEKKKMKKEGKSAESNGKEFTVEPSTVVQPLDTSHWPLLLKVLSDFETLSDTYRAIILAFSFNKKKKPFLKLQAMLWHV